MHKFIRGNSSQWGYQPQGGWSSQNYNFSRGHKLRRRISTQRRPLNRYADKSVAVATIEALIAIINVLERE
jgi:hypothetical protein